jgi:hypothetical protein
MIGIGRGTIGFPRRMDRAPDHNDRSLVGTDLFKTDPDHFVVRSDLFATRADRFLIRIDLFLIDQNRFQVRTGLFELHTDHFRAGTCHSAIHPDDFPIHASCKTICLPFDRQSQFRVGKSAH